MNPVQNEPRFSISHSGKVMLLTCIILAFAVMNGTMFNVAIPNIAEAFDLTPTQVSWVATSFTAIFAIGTLIYGKMADYFSIRRLYTIGLSLFALGSFVGFLSTNYETLIAGRVLQAMGAAAVPPLSFLVPLRFFQNQKGKMFGYLASTIAFASGIGPLVGGVIGDVLEWRYIFLISVASIFAIPFFRRWFPDEAKQKGKIDLIGAALVAATVTSLLFLITTVSWLALLSSILFFILLMRRLTSIAYPFIDPRMLKKRKYTVTLMTSYLGDTIIFGLTFLLPLMLRGIYNLSMLEIGLVLFPGAIASGLIGKWIGKVIATQGGRSIVIYGLLLISGGSLFIAAFAASGIWLIALGLFVAYLGFPLLQSGTADLISSNVSEKENGVGMGLFNLMNFLAGAFSSALFGKLLETGNGSLQLNPFSLSGEHLIYSNIYLIFTVLGLFTFFFFSFTYRQDKSTVLSKLNRS